VFIDQLHRVPKLTKTDLAKGNIECRVGDCLHAKIRSGGVLPLDAHPRVQA